MSFDGDEKRWVCSRGAVMNLHRVSSIVREISREPCLNRSPVKGSKTLKPEKWQSIFDSDGKVSGFQRALKLIILGGVDPSIRPEVWEFLLGCYSLSSTAEYRHQLRMARRERYEDLIRECQSMHSSVGTGTLAYVVGSKVMDVRTLSKNDNIKEKEVSASGTENDNRIEEKIQDTDAYLNHGESYSDSAEPASVRENTDVCNCFSTKPEMEVEEPPFATESYYDFPPLPVTDLFMKDNSLDVDGCKVHSCLSSTEHGKEAMHSFQINNNNDLIVESNNISSTNISHTTNVETETFNSGFKRKTKVKKSQDTTNEITNRMRLPDATVAVASTTSIPKELNAREDRVSEWLWTLHRIVVDVVRTDIHLEFYGDSRNMARMSDILAVYAWIDPATGYCQGMSDLLSPFIVLYEDNADAFWCFEMLLRRLRENFQMEGPIGVMKQLKELWKILELTDAEIFAHLSVIGAESLHFAFRMLLVLFRRELSFSEALRMWEMMWAADFVEGLAQDLEGDCPEQLVLQLPKDADAEMCRESADSNKNNIRTPQVEHNNGEVFSSDHNGVRSDSRYPFCGLAKANFWARHHQMEICTVSSSRTSDDELSVFCVAAILITNRQKITRTTHSIDDLIKMFNDNLLKINVKKCIRLAIKLRKKYYKILQMKHANMDTSET